MDGRDDDDDDDGIFLCLADGQRMTIEANIPSLFPYKFCMPLLRQR